MADQAGEGAGAAGAAGEAGAGAGGVDVAALQTQVATLLAEREADKAAAVQAGEAAKTAAEAERVAKLSAAEQLKDAIAKANGEIETTKAELVTERRQLALERMGVLPHFRDYAPKVDPKTPAGGAELEKWAKAHPEAIARQGAGQVAAIKPVGALAEVLAGTRKSPLLRGSWAETILSKVNG